MPSEPIRMSSISRRAGHSPLPNRQLILPLWIDLALFEKALPLQPLSVCLVPLLGTVFLLHIQRVVLDIQILFKVLDIFLCSLELARRGERQRRLVCE